MSDARITTLTIVEDGPLEAEGREGSHDRMGWKSE